MRNHAGLSAALALVLHGVSGHGDDGQRRMARLAADNLGGRDAVDVRHLDIHQDKVEIAIRMVFERIDCLQTILGQFHLDTDEFKQFAGDLLIHRLIFGHQYAGADKSRWPFDMVQRCGDRRGGDRQFNVQRKATAFALAARRGQRTAHDFSDFSADNQSQSGAAIVARNRGIGLHEGLKQAGDFFVCHADPGIGDRNAQLCRRAGDGCGERDGNVDVPGRRELDGVADEIGDDLAQAQRVTDQRGGDFGCGIQMQRQPFLGGIGRVDRHDMLKGVRWREWGCFQFHPAGGDL